MRCCAHETSGPYRTEYFRFYGYDEEWKGLILFGRFTCVFIFREWTIKFIAGTFRKWVKFSEFLQAFNKRESTEWIAFYPLTFRWLANLHKSVVEAALGDCWKVLPYRAVFSPKFYPRSLLRHSRRQRNRQRRDAREILATLLSLVLVWMKLFDQVEVEHWTAATQFSARHNPLVLRLQKPISEATAANESGLWTEVASWFLWSSRE